MKRSKKELKALKSGYESAILIQSFLSKVVADPDDKAMDDDIEKLNQAETYINWYENTIIK
jgi:hypothetical protein